MKTISAHEIAAHVRANPGNPAGEYVPAEAAGQLLAALERALPWLGRMIADGGHLHSVAPNDAIGAMDQAQAVIDHCRSAG